MFVYIFPCPTNSAHQKKEGTSTKGVEDVAMMALNHLTPRLVGLFFGVIVGPCTDSHCQSYSLGPPQKNEK